MLWKGNDVVKEKVVPGVFIRYSSLLFRKTDVLVKLQSDLKGDTLSFTAGDISIMIPLDKVKDIIQMSGGK